MGFMRAFSQIREYPPITFRLNALNLLPCPTVKTRTLGSDSQRAPSVSEGSLDPSLTLGARRKPYVSRNQLTTGQVLRRMAEGAVKAELGPVVVGDGAVVIAVSLGQGLKRRDDLLRPNDQDEPGPRRSLAQAFQVLARRFDGVLQARLRIAHPGEGRLNLGMSLDHLGGNPVLNAEQLQHGEFVFRPPLVDAGPVAQAEVLQLPQQLHVEIAAPAEVAEEVVEPT